jgi:DNA polymerase-1
MDGTYAEGLIGHIQDDGRIHASFLLDGAESGRMSSAEPNMTNIPRAKGNVEGKMLRNCFVARPGYVLIELDFSQMELRKAAEMSGDPNMIADFKLASTFT